MPGSFSDELRAVGVDADSPWDLVDAGNSYEAAIPVLVEWLERAETEVPESKRERFREGLVRSLTVRQARGTATPALVREFRRAGSSAEYRWAIGNALEVVAGDDDLDDLIELASDPSLGAERQMVVLALGRFRDPRSVATLIELLGDEDVVGHAIKALGKLKAGEAREALGPLQEHPKPWVRKEASKALASMES